MKRTVLALLVGACFVFLLVACGGKKDMAAAEAAVIQFHNQMNAANFDQIYLDSGVAMKSATSRDKFVALLTAVHRKLGAVKTANRQSFFINYGTAGEVIRLSYATQFDGDIATEEFVFHVSGNDVRLAGYHINSEALITQ